MDSLKEKFRPEFINRLDEIIVFNVLPREAIRNIVEIQIANTKKRLAEKEIQLAVSPDVLEYLAKEGYDPHYGARPLKRLIQNKILTPVASLMISHGVLEGGAVSVSLRKGEIAIDVEKRSARLSARRAQAGGKGKSLPQDKKKTKAVV